MTYQISLALIAAGLLLISGMLPERSGWVMTVIAVVGLIAAFFVPI